MTEFNWLGRRFPITSAKTRVSILKGIHINFMYVFSNCYGLYLYGSMVQSFHLRYRTKHNFYSILAASSMFLLVDLFLIQGYDTAQQLETDLNGGVTESIPAEKKLAIFDKLFSAYHDARGCIRSDLV